MANRKRILGRTRAAWARFGRTRAVYARNASLALCFALAGCELVADFDRDQIPVPDAGKSVTPDAGTPDAMPPIPVVDAAAPDEDGGADDVDAGSTADAGP